MYPATIQGALGFDNKLGQLNEANEAQRWRVTSKSMVATELGRGIKTSIFDMTDLCYTPFFPRIMVQWTKVSLNERKIILQVLPHFDPLTTSMIVRG